MILIRHDMIMSLTRSFFDAGRGSVSDGVFFPSTRNVYETVHDCHECQWIYTRGVCLLCPLIMSEKVAIVVGASRGIGATVAITLAAHHYRVVVAAKSKAGGKLPGTLDEVVAKIQQQGRMALPKECDVRNEVHLTQWCFSCVFAHWRGLLVFLPSL
jgi:hypothetical protein